MSKFKLSLKEKALIGITAVLLPIIITFFLIYNHNRVFLKQRILDTLTVIAESYEGQVYQFLDMCKRRAQDFASDGFIRSQLLKETSGKGNSTHILSKHLVKNKIILDKTIKTIHVLSLDGRVAASTDSFQIGMDFSNKEYFVRGKDAVTIVETYVEHPELPELAVAAPVLTKDTGRLIGVIVNFIKISELNKLLLGEYNKELGAISWGKGQGEWKTLEVYLVNKDKLMITQSIFVEDAVLKQVVDTLPVNACLTPNKEMSGFYKDYRGVEVVGASMCLPSMKWVLLVEIDRDEVLISVKTILISTLIMAGVVVLMIVLLFIVFLKRVVRPIRLISDAAKDIAYGDYDVVVPIQASDEIGMLGESFNYMANQIKARETALTKSEASLSAAQKIANLGGWEWDIVKNKVYWSYEALRIIGSVQVKYGAKYEIFLNCVHSDDRDFVKKSVDNAINNKKSLDVDFRIIFKDTTTRFVNKKAVVGFDETGKVNRIIGTLQDITERRQREEEINLLQTLILAVSDTKNLHDALVITLEKVCNATGWIYGEAWVPEPAGKYLARDHAFYSKVAGLDKFSKLSGAYRFTPGIGLPGRTWSSKHPIWIKDVTLDENYPRAAIAKEAGLKAGAAFPVLAGGEVVAIVAFYMLEPRERDERLISLVSSAVVQLGQVIKHKQVEGALHESEERLMSVMNNTPAVIYIKDIQGRFLFINKQFERLFHIKREELEGETPYDCFPKEVADSHLENDRKVFEAKIPMEFDEIATHDDGTIHDYISVKFPLCDIGGTVYAVCGISTDITERRRLEEEKEKLQDQLYHSQRLESVGQLAGGIAHDFNNIMTVIIGYGNLLKMEIQKESPSSVYIDRILTSAEKAANLTQGLLAFSRKQIRNPKPVNLNEIVRRTEVILRKLISENIKLKINLTDKECIVMADSGQIERVLMNLATNSRDAMPDGGQLIIDTDVVEIDNGFIKMHGYGEIGKYALITVTDTGVGMDEETKEKMFEPFFTTKEVGKGTGLGLSIVYGIVIQHDGFIDVRSETGKGAAFKIYLPLTKAVVEKIKPKMYSTLKGGKETILIAEDEESVRELTKISLEVQGYKVIEAVDGEEAVNKFMKNKDKIKLLLLDVVMPGKNVKEVYDEIKKIRPDIKALFMSGYGEKVVHKRGILKEGLNYITKPVSPSELQEKVREVLDS